MSDSLYGEGISKYKKQALKFNARFRKNPTLDVTEHVQFPKKQEERPVKQCYRCECEFTSKGKFCKPCREWVYIQNKIRNKDAKIHRTKELAHVS